MRYKKILFVLCIISCILFAISSAAATDVNDTVGIVENGDAEIIASPQSDDILSDDDANTFTALQKKINDSEAGSTITLDRDYVYDDGFDTKGIEITKAITIDGNNHVIDAKSKSRIFYCWGYSGGTSPEFIVLKNIKFVNGNGPMENPDGGAIRNFWAFNFRIISCDFINCTGTAGNGGNYGSAVYFSGATLDMSSCKFIGCPTGSVSLGLGSDSKITSCDFTDCSGSSGAVDIFEHPNCKIDSCNFKNCSATNSWMNGGAITIWDSENCAVMNCDFKDCYAPGYGGAICADNNYEIKMSNIVACNFTNCRANFGGAAIYNYQAGCSVRSCNFVNCYAKGNITSEDAIKWDSGVVNVSGCTFKDVFVPVPVKVIASDLSMPYTANSQFKVTVYGNDGKVSEQTPVVIKVNGKQVATPKTGSDGIATYKPTQAPGTYKISATALGETVTKTLTVKHIVTLKTATVKKSAKSLVLQATLAKVNGKYLKSKQVTFKFNGKTYKAKTNSKGVAKYTLKSSVLKKLKVGKKVTYQATYLKDTVKKTAKVKK